MIFLDHARLAKETNALGYEVEVDVLVRAEGEAKRRQSGGEQVDVVFPGTEKQGIASWGRTVATMLVCAGLPAADMSTVVGKLFHSHVEYNFWSKVPEGLGDALEGFRATGGKVAIVSNSEGMLAGLFDRLGIARHFDLVADSGLLGIEKPDPRIFQHVLDHFSVPSGAALHLGDIVATDVDGARAAGIRHALLDPFGFYEGLSLDVPRIPDVVTVARALTHHRTSKKSKV